MSYYRNPVYEQEEIRRPAPPEWHPLPCGCKTLQTIDPDKGKHYCYIRYSAACRRDKIRRSSAL